MNMHTEQHFCVYYMEISREQHSGFRSNYYQTETNRNNPKFLEKFLF
jgi:hypothetical protein